MIYLASPYTHAEPEVMRERYQLVHAFTLTQLKLGLPVFSPIVYGSQFEAALGHHFAAWEKIDLALIDACTEFWILTIPGWVESVGVQAEWEFALSRSKPVKIVAP